MCGICGIVDFSENVLDQEMLHSMIRTLRHRGPDDWGIQITGPAGLAHARLSIIDLSVAGHQPMSSEAGDVTITYNGEVYNFVELRQQLEQEGATFRSSSDTEVVLNAFLYWGVNSFQMLNGMFAFAVWDERREELYLVRDRFGIKPLYYYLLPAGAIFGSEIKAMLASQRVSRNVNLAGLHEFIYYGNALGENTMFKGIRKLQPGYYLCVSRHGVTSKAYWQVEEIRGVQDSVEKAADTIKVLLEEAVKSHLVSDVPVGVFLSGGIDSSCVTAFASKHYPERLQTFSVGFDYERGINELPKARQVAEYFHTDHHELHISGYKLPDIIERLVCCHNEPFADAANIPLYLLCEQLTGDPKVILQGDGGDEIFAGYRRYNLLLASRLWRWVSSIGKWFSMCLPHSQVHDRLARLFGALKNGDSAMRMALLLTMESLGNPPTRILSEDLDELLSSHDPFARYRELDRRLNHLDPVQRMLYTDTRILLPDTFLEKVDKSTMAHSIEVRVPLLEHRLTKYVMGLPSSYKVRWGQKKWILRQALRGIVPDAILDAPKTGFGVPYAYWLRKPLAAYMKTVLLDTTIQQVRLFNHHALTKSIDEHITNKRNYGFLLWKALHVALWFQKYTVTL